MYPKKLTREQVLKGNLIYLKKELDRLENEVARYREEIKYHENQLQELEIMQELDRR